MTIKIKLTGILFPQISSQMFLHLDWSSPLVHWHDWTWLYQVRKLTVHFWAYTKPRTWARHRIVCRPLKQNCIKAQIWGRVQKKLKVPVSRVTSVIHKWKKFGIMRTLPAACCPTNLSNWGRRALVREVIKNLIITLTELQHFSVMRGEPCRRTTQQAWVAEWLYGNPFWNKAVKWRNVEQLKHCEYFLDFFCFWSMQ